MTRINKKFLVLAIVALTVGCLLFAFAARMQWEKIYFAGILRQRGLTIGANIELHLLAQQYRDGNLISESYHAMSLTNGGKDWIADNLFNSAGTNVTLFAMYIGCSASTDVFSAAWTYIPAEITGNGLGRALAAWTDTGTGTGNLTKSFSVSGTQTTQLYGLYSDAYAVAVESNLVAAEQQGAGAAKNLIAGDTLAVTIMVTAS